MTIEVSEISILQEPFANASIATYQPAASSRALCTAAFAAVVAMDDVIPQALEDKRDIPDAVASRKKAGKIATVLVVKVGDRKEAYRR